MRRIKRKKEGHRWSLKAMKIAKINRSVMIKMTKKRRKILTSSLKVPNFVDLKTHRVSSISISKQSWKNQQKSPSTILLTKGIFRQQQLKRITIDRRAHNKNRSYNLSTSIRANQTLLIRENIKNNRGTNKCNPSRL